MWVVAVITPPHGVVAQLIDPADQPAHRIMPPTAGGEGMTGSLLPACPPPGAPGH
jgi:hypothetical protein